MSTVYIPNRPSPANITAIDNACIPALNRMMQNGACVDMDALSDLNKFLVRDCGRLEDEIETCTGMRVNPASPPQVRDLLFKKLRVQQGVKRQLKLTKTGLESTGKLEIEHYLGAHPVVRHILDWRTRDKIRGTYAVPFMEYAVKCRDGAYRIFYTLKNTSTDTGRLAGEDPNPMNIPIRTDIGRMIKQAFIASPGCRLIETDYSQIEMRFAAHESGAVGMTEAFKQNKDVHVRTAVMVFHLPPEQIDEMKHRYPMKRTGFGVLYLITGKGLAVQLNSEYSQDPDNPHFWSDEECDALIEQWYAANSEIRDWQNDQFTRIRRYGMAWTIFGRVRLVPEVRSCHTWIQSKGLRQGANLPIQGGAADLFRMALARLHDAYALVRDGGLRCEMLIPIHDAVLSEVDEAIADDVARLTRETMENIVQLRVPVRADTKVGDRWATLTKLKAA